MIGLYYGISTLMLAVILMLFYKIASFLLAEMKKHNVMQRAINETNRRLQDNLQISQNRVSRTRIAVAGWRTGKNKYTV